MRNKKSLYVYLLIFLSACLASISYAGQSGIEVTGNAKVSVVPDMATFSFAINDRGKNLASLKADIDKKTAELISLCKKLNIETKDISSSEVSIRPQYNYQTKSFLGYEVSRNINVVLKNLKKYTELVNGAIASGITNINNIALDSMEREALESKVLGAAIESAKQKATIIANNSGVNLGKVVYVKEGGSPIRLESYGFRQSASAIPSESGAFEPGEISVTASVVVRYAID